MTALMEEKDVFLAAHDRFAAAHGSGPLASLRQEAIDRFAALGLPTTDDEEWRFTPLGPLTRLNPDLPSAAESAAARPSFRTADRTRDGYVVCSLAQAASDFPALIEAHLARHADFEERPFVALNTAFLDDGVFVYLPAGKSVTEPIEIAFTAPASDNPLVWHRRLLVVAEPNSRATVIEQYAGPLQTSYFTNAVTEVALGDGAVLDHYKVQEEGDAAVHIAATKVCLGRASKFRSHNLSFGGRLSRNDIDASLGGEGGDCTLNGLVVGTGEQLIDNHTRIDHAVAHCPSHELYKHVLDGRAQGVFNGKIYVHQDAQKTDAKQTNQTLLLSPDATINTKPQLEIYADDVKCTHGATIGQLDATALFYLRSRGLGAAEARALLTFAFANSIVEKVEVESLRRRLGAKLLTARGLPHLEAAEESP